ncbi:response regulator transcription factor [Desulfoplanes formicivorans]|uniref:Transcriptional regulator n=1 Tax=Desulfoplanes formicivorans TaxID=1592317 RepID=A0A194AIH7_9BACT|nr:response regulator transcription factor [Desulfoplanes formicivorans]GAU09887.1 transcriptional regulator [Desulfoplanes formicivorans]
MADMQILIIDDDEKLCALVAEYLAPMGYVVDMAHDGLQGLQKVRANEYRAVILDVMMPHIDGLEVLKRLRKESDIPVLMLTARGDETDRIVGLEMGADDYLPKTFSPRELLARLRAVTRRYDMAQYQAASPSDERILQFGPLHIERDSRTVRLKDEVVNLTPLEYDLLTTLAESAGRVLTREQLLDAVSGRNYEVFDRSVDVHISSLRRKLGEDPRNPGFIQTVRKVGYLFKKAEESR